jgi:hypothetical protein
VIVTILSSDGSVITTVASAHCDGGAETTAIGSVGDQGHVGAGKAGDARNAGGVEGLPVAHGRQNDASTAGLTCFVRRIEEAHIGAPVHAVLLLVVVVLLPPQEAVALDASDVDDLVGGLPQYRRRRRKLCAQNLAR